MHTLCITHNQCVLTSANLTIAFTTNPNMDLFQVLTRQMSIHDETGEVANAGKSVQRKESNEVSFYIGDSESQTEQKPTKESKIVHPDDRQIDRVGSLGFLYQKTSLDKTDVESDVNAGGQQMLTPVVSGVAGYDGNTQPSLRRESSDKGNVQSAESLDLDNFLKGDSACGGVQTGSNKYSDLHHHALSLDDLEEQNYDNKSDLLLSESSTSLVPSVKSTSSGLVRDDSLEAASSLFSKDSSDRISPLSYLSDQFRPISPLSFSDTESIAPLLSPLPPTPEMMYDFVELEEDLCDNEENKFDVEPRNNLDTPPLPEYVSNSTPSVSDSLNEQKLEQDNMDNAYNEAANTHFKPIVTSREFQPIANCQIDAKADQIQDSLDRMKSEELGESDSQKEMNIEIKRSITDENMKKGEVGGSQKFEEKECLQIKPQSNSCEEVKTKGEENCAKTEPNMSDKLMDTSDTVSGNFPQRDYNIPGAFIKLGTSAKRNIAKPKPATITNPEQVYKDNGAQKIMHSSSVKTVATLIKAKEKVKGNLRKARSKGAKIDDLNIVPSRQHSHNPVSRPRKHSDSRNKSLQCQNQDNKNPSNGAKQIGAHNSRDNVGVCESAEQHDSIVGNFVKFETDSEILGPLKQKKRVSRVKSSDDLIVSKITEHQRISKTETNVKKQERKSIEVEVQKLNVGYAGLPKGKTSDQFKRRTTKFPETRKIKSQGSIDDSSRVENINACTSGSPETTVHARKRLRSRGNSVGSEESSRKKVM